MRPTRWRRKTSLLIFGEITTAIVSGVAACKIDVVSNTDPNKFAEATASDFTKLQIRDASGIAQILWRAGGTGSQWAIVRIGNITGVRWFVATTESEIAPDDFGVVIATGLAAGIEAKNEATEEVPADTKVGVAWDDLQNCYVIAMEFC